MSCDWTAAATAFETRIDYNVVMISAKLVLAIVITLDAARSMYQF
jgi:hypothetical protein